MGNKKRHSMKVKKPTLFQQKVALGANYPDGKCNITGQRLSWLARIRPTPISQEYHVRLIWEIGKPPKVWVFGDELQRLDDPDFPHKYGIDKKEKMVWLCLYRYEEFTSSKFLSNTIIPWTIEWLYFYEIWLATGEWCGGGEHPPEGEPKVE